MGYRALNLPRSLVQFLLLLLLFCVGVNLVDAADNAASPPTATPNNPPSYTNEQLLTQMLLVDVAERSLDSVPALALTFSQDIDPLADYSSFITVTVNGKLQEGSWVLASEPRRLYFTNIQPQTAYRIQIRPGLASKNGLKLQQPADHTLTTRDVTPAFDFATRGSILPAKLTGGLPIRVVNVPELDIEFLRVKPEKLPELLKNIALGERFNQYQLDEVHQLTESVHSQRYVTDAKPNARMSLLIPVETIPELQTPGVYFAVMRQPGRFNDEAYRITQFVVTNIGLHVRLYPRSVTVFANTLDGGKPLADVQLKLQGESETLELTTDATGQASFAQRPQGDLLLTAQLDQQFAFVDLREAALDLSEYPVTGLPDKPLAPFIYSSRDLFRPGENVDLSILLRDRDGKTVAGKNLHVRVLRPDTKLFLENNLVATHPDLGYFNWRLPIPADAPTGTWKAEVRINAKDELPVNTFSFQVEDFMPERMKLSLRAEDKWLTSGKKLMVAVQGDYLYGAPASGNKLSSSRGIRLNRHPIEAFKQYYFGNPADEKLISREDLAEITLNEAGGGFIEVPPLAGKINSPLTVAISATLHETGGRSITRTLDVPFWPAPALVGIRPLFSKDTTETNTDAAFELVRLDADGKPQAGSQTLAVTLVREEREYFWEYNAAEGWQRRDLTNEYPILQQKITLDAKAQAKVSFPVQYGHYRLEVEDPETGLKSAYAFHAGWDWEQAENTAVRPDQIELAVDKQAYSEGETLKLSITPPAAGEAIVAVEGDTLLWSKRLTLPQGTTVVDIPLDKSWSRHDLYATVTAFRAASSQQQMTPNRALGIIHIPLEREPRRLNVTIDAPEKVLPEKTTTVTVRSDNLAGETAIVTLAAVDAGVLSITDFKTPDPFAFYFAPHQYAVNLHDAYGKIIEAASGQPLRQRFGGDATARRGGALAQTDVQIVSLFSGAVNFDSKGEAKIDLAIPGFDGTLRLMAVAFAKERFGSGEREMKVASPVVASLAAPRFLALGDNSFLTVDLNNTTDTAQTVKLNVSHNDLLTGAFADREVVLAAHKRETLRLPLQALQTPGKGQVNLLLTGKDFTARRQLQFPLRPAYPARYQRLTQELKAGEAVKWDAAVLEGFIPNGLKATLSLAATPPLPLRDALQGLLQYPYGCLEQTTSSALPYLFFEAKVAEGLGLEPLEMQTRHERVNAALLRIAGMQLASGGFTLWGSYGEEEYWLTPYVTDFLLDAKAQGFTVPEWLLARALQNLEERLQEASSDAEGRAGFSDNPAHLAFASRAYAGYVLSRVKRAPLSTLRAMHDAEIAKAASGLPLVHLGLALQAAGDPKRAASAIQQGLARQRDEQKYFGDYGSRLRDQAAMVYLLLRYKVKDQAVGAAIKQLAELVHNRSAFSTQEQVFLFLAGMQLQDSHAVSWQAALKIGAASVDLSGQAAQYRSLSAADLQQGVQVTASGSKPLYVALTLDGYPDQLPAPDNDPLEIKRTWYGLDGKPRQLADFKPGQLVLTHLEVSSLNDMNDALVVDLLPAGLEVENTNLQDNEVMASLQLEGMEKPVTELLSSSTLRTEEFRDDRYVAALPLTAKAHHHLFYLVRVVSSGTFAVPPSYAEDMYRPELNGIGATPPTLTIP